MKRSYILGMVFLGIVLGASITFLVMSKNDKEVDSDIIKNEQSNSSVSNREEFISTVDIDFGWENIVHSKMLDKWKSGDKPFVDNLVQEVIQQMAHQKIIADEKESSIMITPERIAILIQMVEENKDKFEDDEIYLDILKRWKKGDFSTVDDDHNIMMRTQGSKTGGAATGIATEEQEIDYILRVFGKDVDQVFDSSTLKEFKKEDETKSIESVDTSWVNDVHAEMLAEWKSGDKTFDERLVEEVMRAMAHQKINTHLEEGSIGMTPKRIDNLMQIVKEHKEVFVNGETYLNILKRWEKSDFSTINDDHATLHDLEVYFALPPNGN